MVELAAEIELPTGHRERLFYRVPEIFAGDLTESADPFIVGAIFAVMRAKADVYVHGVVSPYLIRNLMEYQAFWYSQHPRKYNRVEIQAAKEAETDLNPELDKAICAFSGGVDSCYTIYRHASGTCGRLKRNIQAGLFVQGFDISLEDNENFQRALRTNEDTLKSLGITLYWLQSNHRLLFKEWDETHAAGIASALMLFKGAFSEGIIPGSFSYTENAPIWGSNPTSDHLMSSRSFSIVHDGAVWARGAKLLPIREWQTGYERLRVCYSNDRDSKNTNCGRCGKCLVTLLLIDVMRLPLPCSFSQPLSGELIAQVKELDKVYIHYLKLLFKEHTDMPFRSELTQLVTANEKRLSDQPKPHRFFRRTEERLKAIFRPSSAE